MNEVIQPRFYMAGKSRHMFWVAFAFLWLSILNHILFYFEPLTIINKTNNVITLFFYIIEVLIIGGGWFILLLVYAMKTSIKIYRPLFSFFACAQLLSAISDFLLNCITLRPVSWVSDNSFIHYSRMLLLFSSIIWSIGLVIIFCNKKTGVMLRVSSILFAGFSVLSILDKLTLMLTPSLLLSLAKTSPKLGHSLQPILSIFHQITPFGHFYLDFLYQFIYMAVVVFFFAALSFSKQSKPKHTPAAAVPDIPLTRLS